MWPTRASRLSQIEAGLADFSKNDTELIGIENKLARETLALQMISSLRRLDYTKTLMARDIDSKRVDPNSDMFDPEKAAIFHSRNGNNDEAIWLIFLSIHFGKNAKHGWRMLRDVYSGLGSGLWTWHRASSEPNEFRKWLSTNRSKIGGAFGNHRKYETLDPNSNSSTARVIESFVKLCSPSPSGFFSELAHQAGNDPKKIFDIAYSALAIDRFGRLAKFDFLSLLGRMDLAPIKPGSAYLKGATGPLKGSRLLVQGDTKSSATADELDTILQRLELTLDVGMQVMEDSICNWQKSPRKFIHFRG